MFSTWPGRGADSRVDDVILTEIGNGNAKSIFRFVPEIHNSERFGTQKHYALLAVGAGGVVRWTRNTRSSQELNVAIFWTGRFIQYFVIVLLICASAKVDIQGIHFIPCMDNRSRCKLLAVAVAATAKL